MSRNEFVITMTALIGGIISAVLGLPALFYLASPALKVKKAELNWTAIGRLNEYPINLPVPFTFVRRQANGWEKTVIGVGGFVVRANNQQVRVFSNICTHLGCHIRWHADLGHYVSPCHNGHFDLLGNVLSGPPPRPLDEFQSKVEDGILFVAFPPNRRVS